MTTPVSLDITGRVDPALLGGVAQLSQGIAATGAASEAASRRTEAAHVVTQEGVRTTNTLLRNMRDVGNKGFEALTEKAGAFAQSLGGVTGDIANVGVKSLSAFGEVGMAITATIGVAEMLYRAYQANEAELQRQVVTAGSIKAANVELGGTYASVAEAARGALTADAARLAVAQQIQAVTASQVAVVGEGFSLAEARAAVSAYQEVSNASRIAGTAVDRFTEAQVQHAISSGNMTEQMLILGTAIERSTNAEVEHQNVLRRVAGARENAAAATLQQAQAAYDATRRNADGNRSAAEQIRAEQAALVTLTTARVRATEATAEATRVEEASALAIINATEATERAAQVASESRTLKAKQAEQAAARAAAPSGPTAAQRAQARLASQSGARGIVGQLDSDLVDQRIADLDRLMGAEEMATAAANDNGRAEVDLLLARSEMADGLADKERRRLDSLREAHESYAGRIAELQGAGVDGARTAAEFTNSAFESMGKAIGTHVQALVDGRESVGVALQGMLSDTLISIGKEAIIKGAMEMAHGVAALAGIYTAPLAPGHFAAGAAYLAVGAAAGVAGAALAPSAPAAGAGASGNGGARGTLSDRASGGNDAMAPVQINYYAPVIGGREATDSELGTRLDRFDDAARQRLRRAA